MINIFINLKVIIIIILFFTTLLSHSGKKRVVDMSCGDHLISDSMITKSTYDNFNTKGQGSNLAGTGSNESAVPEGQTLKKIDKINLIAASMARFKKNIREIKDSLEKGNNTNSITASIIKLGVEKKQTARRISELLGSTDRKYELTAFEKILPEIKEFSDNDQRLIEQVRDIEDMKNIIRVVEGNVYKQLIYVKGIVSVDDFISYNSSVKSLLSGSIESNLLQKVYNTDFQKYVSNTEVGQKGPRTEFMQKKSKAKFDDLAKTIVDLVFDNGQSWAVVLSSGNALDKNRVQIKWRLEKLKILSELLSAIGFPVTIHVVFLDNGIDSNVGQWAIDNGFLVYDSFQSLDRRYPPQ